MGKAFFLLLFCLILSSCKTQYETVTRLPTVTSSPFSRPSSLKARWDLDSLKTTPLQLKISDDVLNEFYPADDINGVNPVEQMMNQWEDTLNYVNLFQHPAITTTEKNYNSLTDFYDNELGIYKSNEWYSEAGSGALAITQYYGYRVNKDTPSEYLEIVHADIILNFRDFFNDANPYDLRSVILHELGHFLGLNHQTNFGIPSVMHPVLSRGEVKRTLTEYDKTTLKDLYPLSSFSSSLSRLAAPLKNKVINENELVWGVIELHADGQCTHRISKNRIIPSDNITQK